MNGPAYILDTAHSAIFIAPPFTKDICIRSHSFSYSSIRSLHHITICERRVVHLLRGRRNGEYLFKLLSVYLQACVCSPKILENRRNFSLRGRGGMLLKSCGTEPFKTLKTRLKRLTSCSQKSKRGGCAAYRGGLVTQPGGAAICSPRPCTSSPISPCHTLHFQCERYCCSCFSFYPD